MLAVSLGNKVPLHVQVARTLEQRLQSEVYRPGQMLPSYRDLAKEFSVSLGIVQRAVNDLAGSGLLAVHAGKGIMVPGRARSERVGVAFGLIEPYVPGIAFDMSMALHAERVFSDCDNFLILRSSQANAEREREVAKQLARNGVRGLIIWPVSEEVNGPFLLDLSKQIPIILVDRTIHGIDLPAVIHDFQTWGRDLVQHAMETLGKRRMLVLMDDLDISTYRDLKKGLHEGCRERGREKDLKLISLPISRFITEIKHSNLENVEKYVSLVKHELRNGEYDYVFCFQDEFVDAIMIDSGLSREFPNVTISSTCNVQTNNRMPSYLKAGVVQWGLDYPGMIMLAAEKLQRSVLSNGALTGNSALPISLISSPGPTTADSV